MGLIGKFSTVGAATLASRFLGFFREALIAAILGTGPVADAFYAAFRFPNLFRRLFAEGAFNSAFVPLFAKSLEGGGRAAAREFAEQVFSVLLPILLVLTALAMIFMPVLVKTVIAARFDPLSDKFELTEVLARIMFPYLAAMSLVAMLSGILNSFRRYFLAAAAPVVLNIVLIAALSLAMFLGLADRQTGKLLAWAVVLSGLLQLCLLAYGIRREGFGMRLRFPAFTPQVRRLLYLTIPAAITGGITQINLLVGQNIASAQEGAIAIINYADRLFQLPLGVVAIAISVVLLPELSRTLRAGDLPEAAKLQDRSLEFGLMLTLPATIAFLILPAPLTALVYERGAFDRQSTLEAASVLLHFGWGLPAATLISILRPGYYAREDMRAPMWFAAANVGTNIVLSLLLFPRVGVAGIAIATSCGQWLNALLLGGVLWRRRQFSPSYTTLRNLAWIGVANLAMAAMLWIAVSMAAETLMDGGALKRIGLIAALAVLASAVYFGIVLATGAFGRAELAMLLARRRTQKDTRAPAPDE
jgi:putative peptidoglycan lipid II flippase